MCNVIFEYYTSNSKETVGKLSKRLADLIKLICKETFVHSYVNIYFFLIMGFVVSETVLKKLSIMSIIM